jgi:hypothetical protein
MSYDKNNPQTYSESFTRNFKALMSNVHTALPGVIENYTGNRIASVKPQVQKPLADGTYLDLPVIEEVPIIFPSTSEFSFTYPLKKGDPVWIMFAERSIEEWIKNGGNSKPSDIRRFSLTDAVAIPGVFNNKVEFPQSDNNNVTIQFKDKSITIDTNGNINIDGTAINLNGDSKSFVTHAELNTALQTFLTALNAELTTIQAGAAAAISASGLWLTPLVIGNNSIDISASETTSVKTGG